MNIRDLFEKPIDRPIEGVIKADDEEHLINEIEEYIVTNEVSKHLDTFFEAYNSSGSAQGVWISGFFGSGKSHLLKMLSLVLDSREINGKPVGDTFSQKIDDEMLRAEVDKAMKVPTKSILFNIDQKSDATTDVEKDQILLVFLKVFNEMQGYFSKPYIAQFERDLDNKGKYAPFKEAYEKQTGQSWETGRETAHLLDNEEFAKVYAQVVGGSEEEALKVLDRYQESFSLSIEDFAQMIKEYVDKQEPGFRLNFFVDEVGQYIADNSKLMVNLQTIAESFATKCKGQAWIMVTSQEDLSKVVGDMASVHKETDFSKIQDRFPIRLNLTSSNVSEVIQKRLLQKKSDSSVSSQLSSLYGKEQPNLKTLFEFVDGSRTYRISSTEEQFCHTYPFPQYQYDLFKSAIEALSRHNAFTGKHASVGERSMLGVFQDVAKRIADRPFGSLGSFDLMYEGISKVIKSEHQQSIKLAENNLTDKLAIRLLKALFLVKYLKEFKGSPRNLSILMIDQFGIDLSAHETAVKESLNLLEQNTYVQRTGEFYEFLTDDEKDVENEIKAMEVDDATRNEIAAKVLFDEIIRDTKIRYQDNKQDYLFSRLLDSTLIGREHELAVNLISPFNEHHGDETILINQAMGKPEMLVLLPTDKRLLGDLTLFAKTDKYVRQNNTSGLADSRRLILAEKGNQNQQRKTDLRQRFERLLSESKVIVNSSAVQSLPSDPRSRIIQGFEHLIRHAYPNLKMLKTVFSEDSVRRILTDDGDDLFQFDESTLSEAEGEILTVVRRKQGNGERPKVGTLLQDFSRRPYGWYQAAVMANLAKLYKRGKIELRSDSNLLEGSVVIDHLTNNRLFNNTIVSLQTEIAPAQIQQLKTFHREFFDESNSGNEAKDVGERFSEKLRADIEALKVIRAKEDAYPFVRQLDEPIARLEEWSGKPFAVYLNELSSFKNDWLDDKEDYFDPIRKFVAGSEGKVYREVRAFITENRENLPAFPVEEATLKAFADNDSPFRGSLLAEAKSIVEKLKVDLAQQLSDIRKDAEAQIAKTSANLETLDGFSTLGAEEKKTLLQTSESALARIRDTQVLAVVRDSLRNYLTDGYQAQVSSLNQLVASKAEASGVEEAPAKYITKTSISINFPKAAIETEADLDAYLESVRQAYGEVLKENGKITL